MKTLDFARMDRVQSGLDVFRTQCQERLLDEVM